MENRGRMLTAPDLLKSLIESMGSMSQGTAGQDTNGDLRVSAPALPPEYNQLRDAAAGVVDRGKVGGSTMRAGSVESIDPDAALAAPLVTPMAPAAGEIPVNASPTEALKSQLVPMVEEAMAPQNVEASSFGDKLIHTLFGPPEDASMPAAKRKANANERDEAGDKAASWMNPGAEYMKPVSGGGADTIQSIGKLVNLVSSLFGGPAGAAGG